MELKEHFRRMAGFYAVMGGVYLGILICIVVSGILTWLGVIK